MKQNAYQIPSYMMVDAPAIGYYTTADGWLHEALVDVDRFLREIDGLTCPIPGLSGFFVTGRSHGSGLELTVAKHSDQDDTLLDLPIPISTTFVSMTQADASGIAGAALGKAEGLAFIHPEWTQAMRSVPRSPSG